MKTRNYLTAVLLFALQLFAFNGFAANSATPLMFKQDGTFKIVQFTDIHWNPGSDDPWVLGKDQGEVNHKTMGTILDIEKPDLVVVTGDILFIRKDHNEEDLRNALQPMIDRKLPWAFVLGNHDYEYCVESPAKVISFVSGLPCSLTEPGDKSLGGTGNYSLKILSSGSDKTASVLYMLDSHQDSEFKDKDGKHEGYDHIRLNQILWYANLSAEYTKANGGTPLPSLMFFHIPLPEYDQVWKNNKVAGTKLEAVSSPRDNSGLFTAVREARDVMGIFVGHDHVNDYVGSLNGIALAYGRKTGLTCYGPMPLEKGGRVILLHEGKPQFDTWIRTESGKQENLINFPEYFK